MPTPNGVLEEVEKSLNDPLAGTGGIKMPPLDPTSGSTGGAASLPTESVSGAGILDDIGDTSTPQSDLIDTTGQVAAPSTVIDTTQPVVDPTAKELTDKQLVSGNLARVLDEGGVLMDVARSAGDEYSQARGGLSSSMGAQASMRSMIDAALPIASQDAAAQVSQLQINQANEVQMRRDEILQSYQLQMENLSTDNKALLIDLEQRYAAAIQSDRNASEVYVSTMESIADVMSNSDLSVDQQNAGMGELIGMLGAYLDFNFNLSSVNAVTGDASAVPTREEVNEQLETDREETDAQQSEQRVTELELEMDALFSSIPERPSYDIADEGIGPQIQYMNQMRGWRANEQPILQQYMEEYERLTGELWNDIDWRNDL